MSQSPDGAKINRLLEIMAQLRTPVTGCPWDLEQTFDTIAPYTVEEAYEVADAVERGDMDHLADELGDLLLQVVFHARMAEEAGHFTFDDVVDAICEKMIRRHPHVFGNEDARSAGAVKGMWERIKSEEAAEKQRGGGGVPESILDGVPRALPALARAAKLQKKAARVGFDWPEIGPVFDKIREEIDELEEACRHDGGPENGAIRGEVGDVLFAIANLARHLHLDPEATLQETNGKFTRRFQFIERALADQGRALGEADLEELDALWDDSKARGL